MPVTRERRKELKGRGYYGGRHKGLGKKTVNVSFRIPMDTEKRVLEIAVSRGVSISQAYRDLIETALGLEGDERG